MQKVKVLNGLDRTDQLDSLLKGQRIGLAATGAAVTREMRPAVDVLAERYRVEMLLNMIHGVRGEFISSERVPQYTDERTGLPVHSIFSPTRMAPTAEMLDSLDIVVFDAREAGTRYYEFLACAANLLQACAAAGRPMVVLDRIAPLNGETVEGTVCPETMHTIVGDFGLATRTGLTTGEFCQYVNGEYAVGCDLTIVPVQGWERHLYFDDTDLPWVLPSPSLPHTDANLLYPGMCLFEGVETVSEGRGTSRPFELIGAPWLDTTEVIRRLNNLNLGGVTFGETYFRPTAGKFAGEIARAVQVRITCRQSFESLRTSLALLDTIRDVHGTRVRFRDCSAGHDVPESSSSPTFSFYTDKLLADTRYISGELNGEALLAAHAPALAAYQKRKEKYHLY